MWSYVTDELPGIIGESFPADMTRQSIMGHSMGGHGALTIGLTLPDRFRAVSAFSPIVAPGAVPWGQKALAGYLGEDKAAWRRHDAVPHIADGARVPELRVYPGAAAPFLAGHPTPPRLRSACTRGCMGATRQTHGGVVDNLSNI